MTTRSRLPIFDEFDITELHSLLGYSEVYLALMKVGTKPVPRRFRINACKILNRPADELFGPQEIADA